MKLKLHIILRSFNSDKIIDILQRLSFSLIPIASVNVVIDKKRDLLNTHRLIKGLDFALPIKTIELENYGWSKALNAAIEQLEPSGIASDTEFIMPISNEVMIEPEHFGLLIDAAEQKNASCGYALFKYRYKLSYSIPRNTCMVWKRSVLSMLGNFDEKLDNLGGMEDYDMILRAFNLLRLLPFVAKKRIGLIVRDPENYQKKIKLEEHAIKEIETHYPKDTVKNLKEHLKSQNTGVKIS
jgi:hypothetical protein